MTVPHPDIASIEEHRPLPGIEPHPLSARHRLSPRHYTLLVLFSNGHGYPWIAEHLGLPIGTIKSGMHRARKAHAGLVALARLRGEAA